jgi:hypothetical protein
MPNTVSVGCNGRRTHAAHVLDQARGAGALALALSLTSGHTNSRIQLHPTLKSQRTTLGDGQPWPEVPVQRANWLCGPYTTTASVVSASSHRLTRTWPVIITMNPSLPTQRGRVATTFNYVRWSRICVALSLFSRLRESGVEAPLVDAFGRLIKRRGRLYDRM